MRTTITTVLLCVLASTAVGQVQIIPPSDLATIKSLLPPLANKELQDYLTDDTTMWYEIRSMPPAFQFQPGNGYLPTYFFNANHNFSGDPTDAPLGHGRGGNANVEFPWSQKPGGAHNSPGVDSFKALWLPKDESGKPYPVVWYRRDLPGRVGSGMVVSGNSTFPHNFVPGKSGMERAYAWLFPRGTVFIEALTTRDSGGYHYVFEVRFRIREKDDWAVDVLRPFPTAASLAAAIKTAQPNWQKQTDLSQAVASLEQPVVVRTARLTDSRHTRQRAFDVVTGVDNLPRLPEDLVSRLLTTTPFKSCLGEAWRTGSNGVVAFAPTNPENRHNIVTYKYDGTFVGTDRASCIKCHESTNRHATVFEHPRGWYGRVRGSDGILSWHPIAPAAISGNGAPVAVRFRQEFVAGGILAPYDGAKHTVDRYTRIESLY